MTSLHVDLVINGSYLFIFTSFFSVFFFSGFESEVLNMSNQLVMAGRRTVVVAWSMAVI